MSSADPLINCYDVYQHDLVDAQESAYQAYLAMMGQEDTTETLCDLNEPGYGVTAVRDFSSCADIDPDTKEPVEVPNDVHCWYWPYEPQEDDCCKEDEGCCLTGMPKCPNDKEGNPVRVLSGSNEELETDVQFNTPHQKGFKFYRTYKSRSEIDTTLGFGWTHNYNIVLEAFLDPAFNAYKITDESGRLHFYQDNDGDGTYNGVLNTKGNLVAEQDGTFTWHRPNDIQYTFNQQLQYIAKQDGLGNLQSLTYDANNRLES